LGRSGGEIRTGILIWFKNAACKHTSGILNRVSHEGGVLDAPACFPANPLRRAPDFCYKAWLSTRM